MPKDEPAPASETTAKKPAAKRMSWAISALAISLLTPMLLLIAMLGTAGGHFDYDFGFKVLSLTYAPKMAVLAFGFCALVLLVAVFRDPARSGIVALIATLISGGLLGGFYAYSEALKDYPPISDVATDWSRPVTLSNALIKARGAGAIAPEDDPSVPDDASIKWARKRVSEINAETCPGARPIMKHLEEAPVRKVLEDQGYIVFGTSPWRIEAVYTDAFYGFQSDMIVRLDPDRTDARSISRRQEADLGGNCERVTKLMTALKKL